MAVPDVTISQRALRELEALDSEIRDRIRMKMLSDVPDDPARFLKPLQNTPNYSVRVGEYRIIVEWDKKANELKIHDVGHRSNIYDSPAHR